MLDDYCPFYDIALILVNSTKYGGGGGSYAVASINSYSYEIMLHEMGHSIAGLADEYWAGEIIVKCVFGEQIMDFVPFVKES